MPKSDNSDRRHSSSRTKKGSSSRSGRLESERYEVTVARDGDTRPRNRSRKPFDCIVLDVALPKRNGFDVCRDLRNRGVRPPSSCSPPAASSRL